MESDDESLTLWKPDVSELLAEIIPLPAPTTINKPNAPLNRNCKSDTKIECHPFATMTCCDEQVGNQRAVNFFPLEKSFKSEEI